MFTGDTVDEWFPLNGRQGDSREGSLHLIFSYVVSNSSTVHRLLYNITYMCLDSSQLVQQSSRLLTIQFVSIKKFRIKFGVLGQLGNHSAIFKAKNTVCNCRNVLNYICTYFVLTTNQGTN